MTLRVATFNVLADAYIGYGDYAHVQPELLVPHARMGGIIRLIDSLEADVIGLQEADVPLVRELEDAKNWKTFWSPKGRGKVDGCLMLVRPQLEVSNFSTHAYSDGSGHVLQILRIGRIAFANTHIKWASASTAEHVGIGQAKELLDQLGPEQPAVLFADSNDSFGGPVRQLVERAGFTDISGDIPTALVDQKLVDLDVLAVRGVSGRLIPHSYDIHTIPSAECPSDHIPIVAEIEINY